MDYYNPTPGLSSALDTLLTAVTIAVEIFGILLAIGGFFIDSLLPLIGQFLGGTTTAT